MAHLAHPGRIFKKQWQRDLFLEQADRLQNNSLKRFFNALPQKVREGLMNHKKLER